MKCIGKFKIPHIKCKKNIYIHTSSKKNKKHDDPPSIFNQYDIQENFKVRDWKHKLVFVLVCSYFFFKCGAYLEDDSKSILFDKSNMFLLIDFMILR
jgi:hypothetical protein